MKTLIIGPKHEAQHAKIKYNCDYVISIQDHNDEPVPLPVGIEPVCHKHFFFDDLTSIVPLRTSSRDETVVRGHLPDLEDIQGILAHFRTIPDWSRVYIHCFAGVSRSTAMAFMCNCDQFPDDVYGAMRLTERYALASGIWPNELIVEMADKELNKNGKMIQVLKGWKKAERCLSASDNMDKALKHEWDIKQLALKIDKPEDTK